MNKIPSILSKTKLLRGYRCAKSIYLTIHDPKLEAPITPDLQALFDQGNQVGEAARKFFPGGTLVDNKPWDFIGSIARTRELIAKNTNIIYEAAFEYLGCYARADIIIFSETTQRWRIIEVKSSTKVKPEQIDDVGLQAWIITKSGLAIEQINIAHLNSDCRYPNLENLFNIVDVTADIRDRYLSIKPKLSEIMHLIRQPEIPDTDIGNHCLSPTACGFTEHCWKQKNIPSLSVLNLPGLREKKWDLYQQGIIELGDNKLNDSNLIDLNVLQKRIIQCHQTGERYINAEYIKSALSEWQFPLVFLDFETINPAIPRYMDTKPFQQVPFQFSVHVWTEPNATITHTAFLHDNVDDPRPTLIPQLITACGTEGSIVAYYGKFEAERIQEMAAYSPENAEPLLKLVERIVDPLPIIREAVYDNAFQGSFSLKYVAPALLGEAQSYKGMTVANGGDAQRAFEELISTTTSPQRKQDLYTAMLKYCEKDTYVMVELTKWLFAHQTAQG